jgi:outer membrane protein
MRKLLIGLAAILPAWGAVQAQDNRDIRVRVGAGAQVQPEYIGADSTNVAPLFSVSVARGTNPFRFSAPDDGPSIALVRNDALSFGLTGNIQGKRKASDVGAPVGNVKRTFEVGAFGQYEWKDSFRVRAELLKGINGHDGVVGTVSADKIWRDGDRYVVSLGPRVSFSNGRYQRAYFGVTPPVALATGLPAYRPGSGIHSVGLASGVKTALNDRFGLFGFAKYERLVGHAAKSPIVREFGSRNQFSAGAGINYTFVIHRSPK